MKKTALLLFSSMLFAMSVSAQNDASSTSGPLLRQGSPMPDVALIDSDGKAFRFSERHKTPTYDMLLFWRTDILSSEKELKTMRKLATKYSDYGINIAAVSLNTDTTAWRKAVKSMPKEFAQYRLQVSVNDAVAVADSLGLDKLPLVCLSDPGMKLIACADNADAMKPVVDELIAKGLLTKDIMPQFPGGNAELINFIRRNLRYPRVAQKVGLQGKVIVNFIVDKDGHASEEEIDKSTSFTLPVAKADGPARTQQMNDIYEAKQLLLSEALRVVRHMPQWTPGMVNGRPVKVHYRLPVNFRFR